MFDHAKLTPAPWTCTTSCLGPKWGFDVPELEEANYRDSRFGNGADAEFIALARNAFDVLMRRRWAPIVSSVRNGKVAGWSILDYANNEVIESHDGDHWPDPYTAIVKADKFATEQEAKNSEQRND